MPDFQSEIEKAAFFSETSQPFGFLLRPVIKMAKLYWRPAGFDEAIALSDLQNPIMKKFLLICCLLAGIAGQVKGSIGLGSQITYGQVGPNLWLVGYTY